MLLLTLAFVALALVGYGWFNFVSNRRIANDLIEDIRRVKTL